MEKTNRSSLDDMEDTWLYAFTRGDKLFYIVMSYDQTVQRDVKHTLRQFESDDKGLVIWLGYVDDSDYLRITNNIIRDVEALIRYHEPSWNTSNIKL